MTYSKDDPNVLLSLRQADILTALENDKTLSKGCSKSQYDPHCNCPWGHPRTHASHRTNQPLPVFHPEFGRFMLEATPGKPWGIDFKELLNVEPDMKLRYRVTALQDTSAY